MANYICEDHSNCDRIRSAICLHCHRRLCLEHLGEHNKTVLNSLTDIINDASLTFDQIKEESGKYREIVDKSNESLNQWYDEQKEKLQEIYDQHFKSIESQREFLVNREIQLCQQLEQDALKPLEILRNQQVANIELINHIRSVIDKVRKENASLKQKLIIQTPPIDIASYSSPPPHRLTSSPSKTSDDCEPSRTKRKSSVAFKNGKLPIGHSFKRLIQLFSNIAQIKKNKRTLLAYVRRQGKRLDFASLICSYLTAWHRKLNSEKKSYLLNQYISTIQGLLPNRKRNVEVLFGIQTFFYFENIQEVEMMTFLLEFFFNHQCISKASLLKWFRGIKKTRWAGLDQAKQLARPFIESFSTKSNVHSETNNPTTSGQSFIIQMKDEPIAMNY